MELLGVRGAQDVQGAKDDVQDFLLNLACDTSLRMARRPYPMPSVYRIY